MGRKKPFPKYENVEIIDAGSEGKAVARVDNRVIFVPFVVPGDVVDIQIVRKKKSFFEGRAVKVHKYSDKRVEAKCEHFGLCGGCAGRIWIIRTSCIINRSRLWITLNGSEA